MNRIFSAALIAMTMAACGPRQFEQGSLPASAGDDGAKRRSVFLMQPEDIYAHATRNWQLKIIRAEKDRYIDNVRRFLGGVVPDVGGAELTTPNGFYLVAIDNISWWLGEKILDRQTTCEVEGLMSSPCDAPQACPFQGDNACVNNDRDHDGCYGDDDEPWCDFDDEIRLVKPSLCDQPFRKKVTPPPSKAERKALMHNIQDLGEYLSVPVDNELEVGGFSHGAQFMLDEVYLPTLERTCDERAAWHRVIYTMLLSGGTFLRFDDLAIATEAE